MYFDTYSEPRAESILSARGIACGYSAENSSISIDCSKRERRHKIASQSKKDAQGRDQSNKPSSTMDLPGLNITEQTLRPGLVLAFIDGRLEAPAAIPFGGNEWSVEIFFFLSDEMGSEIRNPTSKRAPGGSGQVPSDQTNLVLVSAMHRAHRRLRLTAGRHIRMILIRLLPHMMFSLFGPDPYQTPSFLGSVGRAGKEKLPRAPEFGILGCSAAIENNLHRLYQTRILDMRPRIYRESIVLELLYLLVGLTGANSTATGFLSNRDKERLQAARRIIDTNLTEPPRLTELSRRCGLSEHKLKKGFKALFANTVYAYVAEQRMETARKLLAEGRMNVNEAGWAVGYSNVSHFIAAFRRHFGVNPGRYRRDRLVFASDFGGAAREQTGTGKACRGLFQPAA